MIQFPAAPPDVTQFSKLSGTQAAHKHSSHVIFSIEKLLKQKERKILLNVEASHRFVAFLAVLGERKKHCELS